MLADIPVACPGVLVSLIKTYSPNAVAQQIPIALFHSQPASNQHLRCIIQLPSSNAFWRPLCHQAFELPRNPFQAAAAAGFFL